MENHGVSAKLWELQLLKQEKEMPTSDLQWVYFSERNKHISFH